MRKVHNSMKSLKKDTLCISKLHTKFSKDVCAMIFSAGFVSYGHFFGQNTCDCSSINYKIVILSICMPILSIHLPQSSSLTKRSES